VSERERLFTPRFFVMCAFSFTVFLSAFQLLPTAPFRILALGGSKFAAGMFLGFLTYASAFSAPLTGAALPLLQIRVLLSNPHPTLPWRFDSPDEMVETLEQMPAHAHARGGLRDILGRRAGERARAVQGRCRHRAGRVLRRGTPCIRRSR